MRAKREDLPRKRQKQLEKKAKDAPWQPGGAFNVTVPGALFSTAVHHGDPLRPNLKDRAFFFREDRRSLGQKERKPTGKGSPGRNEACKIKKRGQGHQRLQSPPHKNSAPGPRPPHWATCKKWVHLQEAPTALMKGARTHFTSCWAATASGCSWSVPGPLAGATRGL